MIKINISDNEIIYSLKSDLIFVIERLNNNACYARTDDEIIKVTEEGLKQILKRIKNYKLQESNKE